MSEAGQDEVFTEEFLRRHTASSRLTNLGRYQAEMAGEFLRIEFSQGFDRYITSEYVRAMETAGLLGLPNAKWYCEPYLVERDWGDIHNCTVAEREARYGNELRCWKTEPLFWRPPRGESMSELCLRVDRVLQTLHRECGDKQSAIVVCHGEVMRAFQIRLERLSQVRLKELVFSENKEDSIFNCQIIHYCRHRLKDGKLSPYIEKVRYIRPTEKPKIMSEWRQIERVKFSNEDLLARVAQVPMMIR